jgi:hypothetical protein
LFIDAALSDRRPAACNTELRVLLIVIYNVGYCFEGLQYASEYGNEHKTAIKYGKISAEIGMMQTVGDRSIMLFGVVSKGKNRKNLHLSITGAPYVIQTYLKSFSLGLQLSFLTILILCTIFRVRSTLLNQ